MTPDATTTPSIPKSGIQILVSTGLDSHPFERLIRWAEHLAVALPETSVVVQHGSTRPPAPPAVGIASVTRAELLRLMSAATVVVLQGGPAAILEARSLGIVPLVVPRDPALNEHVDHHQILHLPHLVASGDAIGVPDETTLTRLVLSRLNAPSTGDGIPRTVNTAQAAAALGTRLEACVERRVRARRHFTLSTRRFRGGGTATP